MSLTAKQKKILWQAVVDHIYAKAFREEMIYGRVLFRVSKEKNQGIPILKSPLPQ